MPDTPADPVAAGLAAVQLRAANVRECPQDAPDALWRSVHSRSARDVPRLLAAVEAVLATAVKWEGEAAGMERAADLDDPEIWNEHAREVREAISRALLGEGE